MLSEKAVQKFKELYQQRFNEQLTDKEAYHRANKLLNIYRTIYGPSFYEPANKMTINLNEHYDEPRT